MSRILITQHGFWCGLIVGSFAIVSLIENAAAQETRVTTFIDDPSCGSGQRIVYEVYDEDGKLITKKIGSCKPLQNRM